MKLSYEWLNQFVKTNLSANEIADKLTMAGLEVEEVTRQASFSGVVVGKVLSVSKHPNADKLRVAIVQISSSRHLEHTKPARTEVRSGGDPVLDASARPQNDGEDNPLQIVCGASNLAEGQLVPLATVGAKLGDTEITRASLRGVDSYGMICSARELGISEEHSGIMVLDDEFKIGEIFTVKENSSEVIDVNVLANRPDCMSVIGLSREVAALTGGKLIIPKVKVREIASKITTNVKISNKDLCPRYMSRVVLNVIRAETPAWMKKRLLESGVRSIDLFVDISNYVMLEYGQPLHFFDLDKLMVGGGVNILVREAKAGETLVTLDGNKRNLTTEMLVIADNKGPIALAGVMGGKDTEISASTKSIFIEAAVFDKANIRKTSRKLGLRSEAVARYEKGLGITSPEIAIERASELLVELANGIVAGPVSDTLTNSPKKQKLLLNPFKLNAFLGTDYSDKQIQKTLESLGFVVNIRTKYSYEVVIPDWRVDINEPVDLYEEVCRVMGFDTVPSTLPYDVKVLPRSNNTYEFMKETRRTFSLIGFTEIMTYSFASDKEVSLVGGDKKEAFELANPLVKEQHYMRLSLVPKMLESLVANQYHKDTIHFFELGKTFHRKGKGLPNERSWISLGVMGGVSWPINYQVGKSFYDIKGAVSYLLTSLGVSEIEYRDIKSKIYCDGQAAEIMVSGKRIGEFGTIRDVVADNIGLKREAAVAVLDQAKLEGFAGKVKVTTPISRFQQSVRDISFVLSKDIKVATILVELKNVDDLLQSVSIIDIYEGKPLLKDQKSVTVRLEIVSFQKTLTDSEVEAVVKVCQNKIEKNGGKVRGDKA